MKTTARLFLVSMLCLPLCAAASSELPPDAIVIDAQTRLSPLARLEANAAQVLSSAERGDVESAWTLLRSQTDAVEFEQLAARSIELLMSRPATAGGEALLLRLEQVPTRVYRQHEETAAAWYLPVYDVAGLATSARRVIAARTRRDALLQDFRLDPVKAIREHRDDTPGVLVDALRLTPEATLERIAHAAMKGEVVLTSPAWAWLARRLPRADVLNAAAEHASQVDLLPLFEVVAAEADVDVALDWLQLIAQRKEFATISVMTLGRLVPRSAAAENALLKHLGRDDTGAAAAAALAQLAVPDRVARIASLQTRSSSPAQLRHLALALRLEGSPQADQALAVLALDPRMPVAASKELQR
jgi:hypothetical protein